MGYRRRGYRPRQQRRQRRGIGVPSVEYERYEHPERGPSKLHQLRQRAGQALGQGRQTVEGLWQGYQAYKEERKAKKRFDREDRIRDLTLEARESDIEARIRGARMRGYPKRAPLPPLAGQRHSFGMKKFAGQEGGGWQFGLNKFIYAERQAQAQATAPKKKKKKRKARIIFLDED